MMTIESILREMRETSRRVASRRLRRAAERDAAYRIVFLAWLQQMDGDWADVETSNRLHRIKLYLQGAR